MKHLFISIENALYAGNNYAALAMSLALPDICGWVQDPSAGSKARYVAWFEKYLQAKYVSSATQHRSDHTFLNGSDCYALRCAYLHEGRDEITDQRAQQVLEAFQFVAPPKGWTVHCNQTNDTLQLQVDVFCRDVIEGATQFLNDMKTEEEALERINHMLIIRDIKGNPL